ncbi:replication-relaxation family protein [Patescibacteria group bacterium]|nr:replication-relaxation family protein [Patescibacteria group bacterium]
MEQTTPKQLNILLLLYRFRFLNRIQIQKLLNHKDPRRINTWLKDLTTRNIIGRKYSKKLLANTKPAIYHLATKSRKILLDHPDTNEKLLKRVYRDKTRSKRLIDHCLLVANIYFYLEKQTQKTKGKLHFFTKTDLSNHYYLPYNRPDAYVAIESKDQTKRYFLEIIDEGTPRFMLRSKIAQYIEYFEEGAWQKKTGYPDPALLFICPNETIKIFLHKHIAQVLEEEAEGEIGFYLTTREIIENNQLENNIWEKVEENDEY